MRSSRSTFDDGNRTLARFGDGSRETQFRPHDVIDRLQIDPAIGTQFIFTSDAVRKFHIGLRFFQPNERRESADVVNFGV